MFMCLLLFVWGFNIFLSVFGIRGINFEFLLFLVGRFFVIICFSIVFGGDCFVWVSIDLMVLVFKLWMILFFIVRDLMVFNEGSLLL